MITYIGSLFEDARAVELRVLRGDECIAGIFDSASALQIAVDAHAEFNLYTTINRPANARITNRMGSRSLRDDDMAKIVRLPFDFDPVRPRAVASTDDELAIAIGKRNALASMLSALQWPMPAVAMSGNGAHALYRCHLPNTAATRDMLTAIYRGLRADFSDEQVIFDSTVRNPSRIWRLYGTVNRKGPDSPERPHRPASVRIPSRWDGVSPKQIEQLANRYAKQATVSTISRAPIVRVIGSGDFKTLDAAAWFQAHGLYKRRIGPDKHAVTCPWADEHSTPDAPYGTDTVLWDAEQGRWPTFHCSHAHCDQRTMRDVVRLLQDADAFCASTWRRAAA